MPNYVRIAEQLESRWKNIRPGYEAVCSDLSFEFDDEAKHFAAMDIRQLATSFQTKWPENLLASLSTSRAIYYCGSHILLILDWLAQKNEEGRVLAELAAHHGISQLTTPGYEIAIWCAYRKDILTALLEFDHGIMETLLKSFEIVHANIDQIELNPKQNNRFDRSLRAIFGDKINIEPRI